MRLRRPPFTAAIISALRRGTQRAVLRGGRSASVRTSPVGPITEAMELSFVMGGLSFRPQHSYVRPSLLTESQDEFPWELRSTFPCAESFVKRRRHLLECATPVARRRL